MVTSLLLLITDIYSIEFKFSIDTNICHMQFHNSYWQFKAAHIMRRGIHGMIHGSCTLPEPTSIRCIFTSPAFVRRLNQRSVELFNTLGFSHSYSYQEGQWYEYSVMADQSHQHNLSGFLQYVSDDADFAINIQILMANIHFTAWEVSNATHLSVTQTL